MYKLVVSIITLSMKEIGLYMSKHKSYAKKKEVTQVGFCLFNVKWAR